MKPCSACKNPKACQKAGKCAAEAQAKKAPPAKPKRTGQFYIRPAP